MDGQECLLPLDSVGGRDVTIETQRSYGRRIGDEWSAGARRVLLGLHDPASAGLLAKVFAEADVLSTLAFSCDHLISEARQKGYGLIVVDGRFLCEHGSRCLQEVRAATTVPVMTMADLEDQRDADVDVAVGPKRDISEVVRRGKALIDMGRPVELPAALRWGPLELDMGRHQARWRGEELHLSTLQFRVMEVLLLSAGSVVSVEQLSRRVWGDTSVADRDRLVAHVRRIRRKIEEDPSNPRFLLRVRGRGFRLAEPAARDENEGDSQ